MANPLLTYLVRLLRQPDQVRRTFREPRRIEAASAAQASATIFLVMRRLRAPLIALVVIFAVSVL